MGRLNLVLVESDGKPLLIIDAIEFIPQAKEIKEYHLKAKTALEEGLKKVKEIAHKMGVREVGANAFSNSSNLGQVIEELGYTSEKDYDIKLVRRKKLNEVLGINDKITYFLQSAEFRNNDYITPIQLHYFEHFLNSEYLKDKKRREELNSLINRGRMDIASKKIAEYDETHHPDSELGKIFEAGEEILDDYSEDMIDGGEKEKQTETDSDAYDVLLMDVPESNLRETNKPQDAPYEKTEKKKKLHIDVRAMIARDALERLYSREPTRKESSTRLVKIM